MFDALRREYRRFPPRFWLLIAGTLVNRVGSFVIPFLTLYLTGQREYSESAAALVVSLYGFGSIGAAFFGGVLSDRVGRRRTLLLSLWGGAVALLALGRARSPEAIGACAFAFGFVGEMYRPAVGAMIADIVPPADRARAYAHSYWAVNLGFAIAPTLGGLLAGVGYEVLFVADAVTMALFGGVIFATISESRPEPSAHEAPGGLADVLADRTFLMLVGLTFCLAIVIWQSSVALPLDMKRKGLSEADYGMLIALNGLLIVLLQPLATTHVLRFRRSTVLAWGMLLFGLGFGLHAVAEAHLGYAVAIGTWTLGEILNAPVMSAVIADLAPPALRGRYQGVHGMAWASAAGFGPLAGGAVFDHLGPALLWGGCFALCALAAVGHRLVGPAHERRAIRPV
jgi:MFS family permease